MPYLQAYEIFTKPNASLAELLDSLEDLGVEYGYILGSRSKQNPDIKTDLVRILTLSKLIKAKIKSNYET